MKKFLSLVLALVMVMSLTVIGAGAVTFTDASSIKYKNAVDVTSTIALFDGYTDGSFNPGANLTRGAAAKIICNMVLGPTTASALGADAKPFKDVATNNVFAGYIAYCSQQGIINGYADGTFKPAGNVTGYQFLKMLLGALGYNGKYEGFTGANWSINVAKLALGIGLTKGNEALVGSKALTREEAALYAFNTLKATMVEYTTNGSTITVGDTVISQTPSKASDVANRTNTDGNIYVSGYTNGKDGLMQFAERYFSDLKCTNTIDDLGREANKWTYKGAKVGTYSESNAVVSYTAETKESAVKSDMGSYSYKSTAVDVYYNGFRTSAVMSNAAIAKLTGNGTLVEVYVDNNEVNKVIVAQAYLGKVTSVNTKNETITVNMDTTAGSKTITDDMGYGSFVKDDMVMVTPQYTSATNAPASIKTGTDANIYDIVAAQKTTGKITGIKLNSYLIMDGTTYNYAVQRTGSFSASVNNTSDADIYLDAYGYVVDANATASSGNYLYLARTWEGTDDYGAKAIRAQVVLSDGTISSVVVSKVNGTDNATPAVGMYRYSTSNNKYELTSTDSYMQPAVSATIESSTTKVGNGYFSDSTNMVVVSGATGSDLTAKVYTGKHATSGTATCYFTTTKAVTAPTTGTIATIFVVANSVDVVTNSTDLIYCANPANQGTINANGTNYTAYELYVNGVSNTVASKTTPEAHAFYTYGVDDNGVYTLAKKTAGVATNVRLDSMYNSQYVTINASADLNGGNYTASDATIVDVNTDDDYDFGSIGDVQSALDDGKTVMVSVAYNTTDKTISVMYVISVA